MSIDVKYRTAATATGGRDGRTRTEDGKRDLQLAIPKEIGGPGGDGVNPEQLFAAGYAACFLSSVKGAGQKLKGRVSPEATVKAQRFDQDEFRSALSAGAQPIQTPFFDGVRLCFRL